MARGQRLRAARRVPRDRAWRGETDVRLSCRLSRFGTSGRILSSGRGSGLASAQQGYEGDRAQHHPRLSADLPPQEIEAAEGEPEEPHDAQEQADEASSDPGHEEPPVVPRCLNTELRQEPDEDSVVK